MTGALTREGFDIELRYGEAREDAFVWVLYEADVAIKTIEHKSDLACRRTGNVFVEYRQKGRPSGISTTQSDYWATEFDDDCWVIIPTKRMKQIARRAMRDKGRRTRGGDFNNYEGVLVPIQCSAAS